MADMSADAANAEQCNRNGNQALASEQLMEVTAPPPRRSIPPCTPPAIVKLVSAPKISPSPPPCRLPSAGGAVVHDRAPA